MGGGSLVSRAVRLADAAPGVRPGAEQLGQWPLCIAPREARSSNRHVVERRLDVLRAGTALARCIADTDHGKRARLAVAAPRTPGRSNAALAAQRGTSSAQPRGSRRCKTLIPRRGTRAAFVNASLRRCTKRSLWSTARKPCSSGTLEQKTSLA